MDKEIEFKRQIICSTGTDLNTSMNNNSKESSIGDKNRNQNVDGDDDKRNTSTPVPNVTKEQSVVPDKKSNNDDIKNSQICTSVLRQEMMKLLPELMKDLTARNAPYQTSMESHMAEKTPQNVYHPNKTEDSIPVNHSIISIPHMLDKHHIPIDLTTKKINTSQQFQLPNNVVSITQLLKCTMPSNVPVHTTTHLMNTTSTFNDPSTSNKLRPPPLQLMEVSSNQPILQNFSSVSNFKQVLQPGSLLVQNPLRNATENNYPMPGKFRNMAIIEQNILFSHKHQMAMLYVDPVFSKAIPQSTGPIIQPIKQHVTNNIPMNKSTMNQQPKPKRGKKCRQSKKTQTNFPFDNHFKLLADYYQESEDKMFMKKYCAFDMDEMVFWNNQLNANMLCPSGSLQFDDIIDCVKVNKKWFYRVKWCKYTWEEESKLKDDDRLKCRLDNFQNISKKYRNLHDLEKNLRMHGLSSHMTDSSTKFSEKSNLSEEIISNLPNKSNKSENTVKDTPTEIRSKSCSTDDITPTKVFNEEKMSRSEANISNTNEETDGSVELHVKRSVDELIPIASVPVKKKRKTSTPSTETTYSGEDEHIFHQIGQQETTHTSSIDISSLSEQQIYKPMMWLLEQDSPHADFLNNLTVDENISVNPILLSVESEQLPPRKEFDFVGTLAKEKVSRKVALQQGKEFVCQFCNEHFEGSSKFMKHNSVSSKRICPQCSTRICNKNKLLQHMKSHVKIFYQCHYCLKSFNSRGFLSKHKSDLHARSTSESSNVKKNMVRTTSFTRECLACRKRFKTVISYIKHMRRFCKKNLEESVNSNVNKCKTCMKGFIKESSLVKHEKLHKRSRLKINEHATTEVQEYSTNIPNTSSSTIDRKDEEDIINLHMKPPENKREINNAPFESEIDRPHTFSGPENKGEFNSVTASSESESNDGIKETCSSNNERINKSPTSSESENKEKDNKSLIFSESEIKGRINESPISSEPGNKEEINKTHSSPSESENKGEINRAHTFLEPEKEEIGISLKLEKKDSSSTSPEPENKKEINSTPKLGKEEEVDVTPLSSESQKKTKITRISVDSKRKTKVINRTITTTVPIKPDKKNRFKTLSKHSLQRRRSYLKKRKVYKHKRYCMECLHGFKDREMFYQHINTKKCPYLKDNGQCMLCKKFFHSLENLKTHVTSCFKESITSLLKPQTRKSTSSTNSNKDCSASKTRPVYHCSKCNTMFPSTFTFRKHRVTFHPKHVKLNCPNCLFTCVSRSLMKRHVKKNLCLKVTSYPCFICEQSKQEYPHFGTLRSLLSHIKDHKRIAAMKRTEIKTKIVTIEPAEIKNFLGKVMRLTLSKEDVEKLAGKSIRCHFTGYGHYRVAVKQEGERCQIIAAKLIERSAEQLNTRNPQKRLVTEKSLIEKAPTPINSGHRIPNREKVVQIRKARASYAKSSKQKRRLYDPKRVFAPSKITVRQKTVIRKYRQILPKTTSLAALNVRKSNKRVSKSSSTEKENMTENENITDETFLPRNSSNDIFSLRCFACTNSFKNMKAVVNHFREYHCYRFVQPRTCEICHIAFKDDHFFILHHQYAHSEAAILPNPDESSTLAIQEEHLDKSLYICKLCDLPFLKSLHVKEHYKDQHKLLSISSSPTPYLLTVQWPCCFCHKEINNIYKHAEGHSNTILECFHCNVKVTKTSLLSRHLQLTHRHTWTHSDDRWIKDVKFENIQAIVRQMYRHRKSSEQPSEPKTESHQCICQMIFYNSKTLKRHQEICEKTEHLNNNGQVTLNVPNQHHVASLCSPPKATKNVEKVKKASDKDLDNNKNPLKHNHGSKSKSSDGNTKEYKNRPKKYKKRRFESFFACPLCRALYSESKIVTKHLTEFHEVEEDLKSNLIKNSLDAVVTVNINEIHNCELCKMRFPDVVSTWTHKMWHVGVGVEKCEVCAEVFTNETELLMHAYKNHGIFLCAVCHKGFHSFSNLEHHCQLHVYECNVPRDDNGKMIIEIEENECLSVSDKVPILQDSKFNFHVSPKIPKSVLQDEQLFYCHVCRKNIEGQLTFIVHMKTHFTNRQLVCFHCLGRFEDGKALSKHYKKHYTQRKISMVDLAMDEDTPGDEDSKEEEEEEGDDESRNNVCHFCSLVFEHAEELQEHMKSIVSNNNKPFQVAFFMVNTLQRYVDSFKIECDSSKVKSGPNPDFTVDFSIAKNFSRLKTFFTMKKAQKRSHTMLEGNNKPNKFIMCPYCCVKVKRFNQTLTYHLSLHKKEGQSMKCAFCEKFLLDRFEMLTHCKDVHRNCYVSTGNRSKYQKNLYCQHCDLEVDILHFLRHFKYIPTWNLNKIRCFSCNYVFPVHALQKHIKTGIREEQGGITTENDNNDEVDHLQESPNKILGESTEQQGPSMTNKQDVSLVKSSATEKIQHPEYSSLSKEQDEDVIASICVDDDVFTGEETNSNVPENSNSEIPTIRKTWKKESSTKKSKISKLSKRTRNKICKSTNIVQGAEEEHSETKQSETEHSETDLAQRQYSLGVALFMSIASNASLTCKICEWEFHSNEDLKKHVLLHALLPDLDNLSISRHVTCHLCKALIRRTSTKAHLAINHSREEIVHQKLMKFTKPRQKPAKTKTQTHQEDEEYNEEEDEDEHKDDSTSEEESANEWEILPTEQAESSNKNKKSKDTTSKKSGGKTKREISKKVSETSKVTPGKRKKKITTETPASEKKDTVSASQTPTSANKLKKGGYVVTEVPSKPKFPYPFSCVVCGRGYFTKSQYLSHYKTTHPWLYDTEKEKYSKRKSSVRSKTSEQQTSGTSVATTTVWQGASEAAKRRRTSQEEKQTYKIETTNTPKIAENNTTLSPKVAEKKTKEATMKGDCKSNACESAAKTTTSTINVTDKKTPKNTKGRGRGRGRGRGKVVRSGQPPISFTTKKGKTLTSVQNKKNQDERQFEDNFESSMLVENITEKEIEMESMDFQPQQETVTPQSVESNRPESDPTIKADSSNAKLNNNDLESEMQKNATDQNKERSKGEESQSSDQENKNTETKKQTTDQKDVKTENQQEESSEDDESDLEEDENVDIEEETTEEEIIESSDEGEKGEKQLVLLTNVKPQKNSKYSNAQENQSQQRTKPHSIALKADSKINEKPTKEEEKTKEEKTPVTPSVETFPCTYCSALFYEKTDLTEHLPLHNRPKNSEESGDVISPTVKTYPCENCSALFYSDQDLKDHTPLHNINSQQKHTCNDCGLSFTSKTEFSKHLPLHTSKGGHFDQPYPVICIFCNFGFYSRSPLKSHLVVKHANFYSKDIEKSPAFDNLKYEGNVKKLNISEIPEAPKRRSRAKFEEMMKSLKGPARKQSTLEKKNKEESTPKAKDKNAEIVNKASGRKRERGSPSAIESVVKKSKAKGEVVTKNGTKPISIELKKDSEMKETSEDSDSASDDTEDTDSESDDDSHDNKEYNYTCKYCDQLFTNKDSRSKHIKRHFNGSRLNQLTCTTCFCLINRHELKWHMHITHDEEKLSRKKRFCKHCNYSSKKSLEKHIIQAHPSLLKIECRICDERFSTTASYNEHFQMTHGKSMDEEACMCLFCNKKFPNLTKLYAHFSIVHMKKNKDLHCALCSKYFYEKIDLENHDEEFHKDDKYQCGLCFKDFKSVVECEQHVLVHKTATEFQCRFCKFYFEDVGTLKRHSDMHEEIFKCKICDCCFKKFQDLKSHMDENEKCKQTIQVCCLRCDKSFTEEAEIESHADRHSFKQSYQCTSCEKSFKTISEIQEHMDQVHQGGGSSSAQQTDKETGASDTIEETDGENIENVQSYVMRNQCEKCGETFIRHEIYLEHMKKH